MDRKAALQQRLEEAFRGSRYHSFMASLKGVSEEAARWTPPHYRGFPHMTGSILNLAFHTGGDKSVLISHSFGDASVSWEQVTARFESLGGDLTAAKRLAEEGHAKVLETLASLTDADLDAVRPYYGGKRLTAYEVFTIITEHDLYHAGQINYVRCLIEGIKP
jgi:hypothetical protein